MSRRDMRSSHLVAASTEDLTPKELKSAMSDLGKSLSRALRLASPGTAFSGAFKPLRDGHQHGLEVAASGDRLFVRGCGYEIELYPMRTPEQEDELLATLEARRQYREHRERTKPSRSGVG